LFCLLTNGLFDEHKDILMNVIKNKHFEFNKYTQSSILLYKWIKKNKKISTTINNTNCFFYLEATKKLFIPDFKFDNNDNNNNNNDNNYSQDYIEIICSDYIYNYAVNVLGSIAVNYYMDNNTMLAREIYINIDPNKTIDYFKNFASDVIEYNFAKLYDNICKGLYTQDYIPLIKNIIFIKHNINVKYKDLEDFKIKIKPIIPELLKVQNFSNLDCCLELFNKAILDSNQELCFDLLKNNKLQSYKFYEISNNNNNNNNNNYGLKQINKEIILIVLNNNLDEIVLSLIQFKNIELIEYNFCYYGNEFMSDKMYNTFLELLFIKNKIGLIKKIIDNKKINEIYQKKKIITSSLYLSFYYNVPELMYDIFENNLLSIEPEIFIYNHNKIKSTNFFNNNFFGDVSFSYGYSNNSKSFSKLQIKIEKEGELNPYKNICGFELIFQNNLEYIIDKSIEKFVTTLPHYLIDKKCNSLFTLMIQNNQTKRLEQVINFLGKKIFNHIPMFVLNGYNLSFTHQLSNGLELYWACKKNLNNIAWFLVSNKLGNIGYTDSDENTCLILACENRMDSVAQTLITHMNTILINHTNNNNLKAYDYAKKNNLTNVCLLHLFR